MGSLFNKTDSEKCWKLVRRLIAIDSHISHSLSFPVSGVVGAGVDGLDEDEGVEEVGGDHVGGEGRVGVLEDDGHDVVADVPLPLQLLRLALRVRQQRRNVEHDLLPPERLVQALHAVARHSALACSIPDLQTGHLCVHSYF